MKRSILIALVIGATLASACSEGERSSSNAAAEEDVIQVVATTSMLTGLVRTIGGDRVSVEGLMGPGDDPHLYKASEGDVARMAGADVVFYSGLHLEGKMTEVFEQMRRRGKPTVALAETALPDSLRRESPNFAGNYDPHVWFSVPLWERVSMQTAEELARIDPEHAEEYQGRAEAYRKVLREVDAYVRQRAEEIARERRILITSHDAFGYFGEEYGFDVHGLQGISTATEAGTADVQALAAFVAERRVPALFVETSVPRRGIEAVREAVRARGFDVRIGGTLYGDALGGPGSGADTYAGMVRANIDTIVEGLTETPPS